MAASRVFSCHRISIRQYPAYGIYMPLLLGHAPPPLPKAEGGKTNSQPIRHLRLSEAKDFTTGNDLFPFADFAKVAVWRIAEKLDDLGHQAYGWRHAIILPLMNRVHRDAQYSSNFRLRKLKVESSLLDVVSQSLWFLWIAGWMRFLSAKCDMAKWQHHPEVTLRYGLICREIISILSPVPDFAFYILHFAFFISLSVPSVPSLAKKQQTMLLTGKSKVGSREWGLVEI